MEYITLNNQVTIPILGLGTYRLKGKSGIETIKNAINLGYTLIDTAQMYQNEKEVSNDMFYDVGEKIQELLNGQSKLTWGQMYPQRKLDEVIIDILKKLKMISTDTEKNEAGDAYYLASSTTSD